MTKHEKSSPKAARSIFSDPTEHERLYFEMIDRAVANNDERVISNGRSAHAVYILSKFFEIAKKRIIICSGHLRQTFDDVLAYAEPGLIARASDFLRRGGSIKILVVDDIDICSGQSIGDHPFVNALSRVLSNENDTLGKLIIRRHDNLPPIAREYHFIVVDGKSVRLEVNPKNAEAYVRLNDTNVGSVFEGVFSEWMKEGTDLISVSTA